MCGCSGTDGGSASGDGASAVPEQAFIVRGTTNPTITGTTNTAVVVWSGSPTQIGTVAVGDWATVGGDAVVGTTFTITQPGVYWASFNIVFLNNTVYSGVSLDATVAQLTQDPTTWEPEYGARFEFIQGASAPQSLIAAGTMTITNARINAGENIVRCHLGDGSNMPPTVFNLVTADTVFYMERIGEAA